MGGTNLQALSVISGLDRSLQNLLKVEITLLVLVVYYCLKLVKFVDSNRTYALAEFQWTDGL